MNDELQNTINSSVVDVLERMKNIEGDDRYHVLMEWMEYLVSTDIDSEDILLVPNEIEGRK
mgnify:CR=1 FL=1